MKKLISALFLMAVFVFPMSAFADSASSEEPQTLDQIKEHYEYIFNKYQVNEPFSAEDAAFIQEHAKDVGAVVVKDPGTPTTFESGTKYFKGSNTNYALTGYINYDYSALGKNKWDVYMTAWDIAGIKRNITGSVKIDGFGVVDISTGAVGKVYTSTLSSSSSSKVSSFDMSKNDSYSGLLFIVYYYPKATFDGYDLPGTIQ
ncbi:hypothetical protein ABID47_004956 [Paenibacillus favisporus]|uniref:DUF3993 domain-containing protein n=1 Tax=Paenibacillus favisporus TaxID=221028 RepID=A0ABV2F977_9BACL